MNIDEREEGQEPWRALIRKEEGGEIAEDQWDLAVHILEKIFRVIFKRDHLYSKHLHGGYVRFIVLVWMVKPEIFEEATLRTLSETMGLSPSALSSKAVRMRDELGFRSRMQKRDSTRKTYSERRKEYWRRKMVEGDGEGSRKCPNSAEKGVDMPRSGGDRGHG